MPELMRALADPAHAGRLFTHWYDPVEDLGVKFNCAGMMIVFRDEDQAGEVGSFDVMADGHARIGHQHCALHVERVRTHEPVSSSWGDSATMKPDPWSSEPQRTLETITWQDDPDWG